MNLENKRQYNGKEKTETHRLLWNNHGARNLDLQLGRWWSLDPIAEKPYDLTPFRFGFNNPIRYFDEDGRWEKDRNGNLIAEPKDNAYTLARYLNTDGQTAIKMLDEQGYKVNNKGILSLKIGDVFSVDYGNQKPEKVPDLGLVGNQIREEAGSEFSKKLFENFWQGGGDYEMTGKQFAGILIYLKEAEKLKDADATGGNLVSFYDSETYSKAFGSATVITNEEGNVVGFYDFYDFDSKPWGERSFINELITRSVQILSTDVSKSFIIRYGKVEKK